MTMDPGFLARASGRIVAPPVPFGYTVVTFPNGGHSRIDNCVSDVFEQGVLTLTNMQDGEDSHTFPPGGWTEAATFSSNNHLIYVLLASAAVAERRAS